MTTSSSDATGERVPLLRVVRGNPSPEELAALIAVVTSRAVAGGLEEPPPPRSLWARPTLRSSLPTGPGAWRASSLPR